MASIILSSVGSSVLGPIGGFLGSLAGASIDNYITNSLTGTLKSPSKLGTLKVQSSQDGANMPIIYGKAKIAGQIIWASKFKETAIKRRVGGKNGQNIAQNYYSISFAIGLCEGEINGIGKVWANGEEFDLSMVEHRIYNGGENQSKDPLIEAIEGIENTPKYNGIAYIVFEDFPLENFGDRIPFLSFEIFSRPKNYDEVRLEDLIKGVCLIPGAGEFALATTPINHVITKGKEDSINLNQAGQKTDLIQSLDNLERDLPNAKNISLVAAWFGNDLRAENCTIMPKTDRNDKITKPREWSCAGLNRANAPIVSQFENMPAYGGSPDDASIIEAIKEINKRGMKICFNPFIMMDIAQNNNLPNLDNIGFQPPYPWRGRIGINPNDDGTQNANNKINTFYGTVNASHFIINNGIVAYNGANEWSYSRFVLHLASLCKAAGGVDSFLIGSELISLTRIRGENGEFPFVDKLVTLAAEVRNILGVNCKISYAADWTEYGSYYKNNNTYFPLDKLWANTNINFIGIDYYAPLSDRHELDERYDINQLMANIEANEGYDYYYANETARINKQKTPIIDTLYNEPWVYRQKDLRGFWANNHYERINGTKAQNPTLWLAKSKPIRIMELGYPAINRGANRPSTFPDAKSSEAGIPPFCDNSRDDMEQSNALTAFLTYWSGANNPISTIYNAPMIEMEKTHIWAWDARPFPAFPNLKNVWSDGENLEKGHWIMGRMGHGNLPTILYDIAARAGFNNIDISKVSGIIDGYIIEQPDNARNAIEPLLLAFGIDIKITNEQIIFTSHTSKNEDLEILEDLILYNQDFETISRTYSNKDAISRISFACYSSQNQYETVKKLLINNVQGQMAEFSMPLIADNITQNNIANRLLNLANISGQMLELDLPPKYALAIETGDKIKLNNEIWQITEISYSDFIKVKCNKFDVLSLSPTSSNLGDFSNKPLVFSSPLGIILDLPYPFNNSNTSSPSFCAAQSPWWGKINISMNNKIIGGIDKSATIGLLQNTLPSSQISQKLNFKAIIKLDFGDISNKDGYFAILENNDLKDIIYFENAVKIATDTFELRGIVRGLNGINIAPIISTGAIMVYLDDAINNINIDNEFIGLEIDWNFSSNNYINDSGDNVAYKFFNLAKLPFAPCHIKAKRTNNAIQISFIRRANGNGDGLEQLEVPNSQNIENYQINILNNSGVILRNFTSNSNIINYSNIDEISDFGNLQTSLKLEICQIADDGRLGLKAIDTVTILN